MRVLLLLLLAFPACAAAQQRTVRFDTRDGCSLEAFYLAPSSGAYVVIAVHGLGSDKNEWGPFQETLAARGLGLLALDMRGHGASRTCAGKTADYRLFGRAEWNGAARDILGAEAWLKERGIPAERTVLCGASIGANLSLKAAAEGGGRPAAAVLLSPGLEYAGVSTAGGRAAAGAMPVLIAASENDPYAWRSSRALAAETPAGAGKALFLAGPGGHGAQMLKDPLFAKAVADWILSVKPAKRAGGKRPRP